LPELELELDLAEAPSLAPGAAPVSSASPSLGARAAATHGPSGPALSAQLELDDDEPGGLLVALEGEVARHGGQAARTEAQSAASGAPSVGARRGEPAVGGVGPSATATADGDVRDEEVAALAGYGPAPYEWLPSLRYAIRVLQRRRVLVVLLGRARTEAETGRRKAQGTMLGVLESIRDREGDSEDELAAILRPVVDLGAQVSTQSEALARTLEKHRADRASFAAELAARQAEREALQPERRTAQVWVEDAGATVTRLKSELARLSRELTVAHEDAARAAGASDFAPPEHAHRITDIEQRRARTTSEAVDAERLLAERRSNLAAVDRRIAESERAIADVHARAAAADRRAAAEQRTGEQQLRTADQGRLDASEAALRQVVRQHPTRVTPDEHERFLDASEAMARAARQVLLHERAMSCHHPEAFRRGLLLLGGGLTAALVLLALVVRALA
jgi:hypothetical protein